ncbi:MAG: class I SAM-dependent methyltransferase [Methylotenera sp.]|nr:class I SAM-dependent methyltransferase [Methylotenera sp.]
MSSISKPKTGTSEEVLNYYSRNWDKIANCYTMDEAGLPSDPAWYRRRLYQQFLERTRPKSVLDIGCGGGWTVLDAIERGVDARGVEPVAELKEFGCKLLQQHGHDSARITQDDLSSISDLPAASEDCIALLSVLPHVPRNNWDDVHKDIARTLKPGGRLIAAYRNELFDLFTFNGITMEFYDSSLWDNEVLTSLRNNNTLDMLKGLITNPDVPGPYFSAALDKSFGKLDRMKSNPMTMPSYLEQFGLKVERTRFFHFHCVPPILADKIKDYRNINHQMEMTMSDDWRATFMAAIFMVEVVKA